MLDNFYISAEYNYINGRNGNIVDKHKISNRIFSFCVAVSVEKGSFFVEIGDERYDLAVGQTIFIPSFIPHAVGTDEPSVVTYAHFTCSYLNMDIFHFSKNACIISDNVKLCNVLKSVNNSALSGGVLGKIKADKAICNLIIALLTEGSLEISLEDIDFRLYNVLSFIKQNVNNGICVDDVIAMSGYAKTSFYKIFTEKLNMTPHEYIEQERMKLATLLLAQGKKVKDIAFDVGYSDEFYFIKKFKNVVGKTPTQYKKSMEGLLYGTEKSK